MKEYHKISTIWERDTMGNIIPGQYSSPELEFLSTNMWVLTEKVDGTNIRVMYDGTNITFGGRTDNAQIPQTLVNRMNELFLSYTKRRLLANVFPDVGAGLCLYGEGFGAKIQKGGGNYKADGQDFCLFDVWIGGRWLKRIDVVDVANKLSLCVAPLIGEGTILDASEMAKQGFNSQWGNFIAEGIVLRPRIELFDRLGKRIIAKIKHRDFKVGSKAESKE